MMTRTAAFALTLCPLALLAGVPAQGQDAEVKVNQVIVYDEDSCPPSTADEIVVCVRYKDRYRIPEILRGDPLSPKNEAWTDRVEAYETVGAQGIASCSPVGVGGATGCMAKLIDAAYKERRDGGDTRFGQLIEAERTKRLSTIDAEAAATQARVEQLEREYDARIKAERDAELPGAASALPTPPN